MAAVLIILLFGTGLLLKFSYRPFPDLAYDSILMFEKNIPFGQLIRNIHHWSGNILIILVFLHFLRVYFTGAYLKPRRLNWIVGLVLFSTILFANFTGYLLPWDQLAYWAITICTGMLAYIPGIGIFLQHLVRGGTEVGQNTLSIFFAIHTAVLPMVLILLLPYHFWCIRKAGGLVVPQTPLERPEAHSLRVPTIPNLLVRELAVAAVLIACVLWLAIFFNAPLQDKANPGLSPNPTKAPWYFAGLQELLLSFHPLISVFIIPSIVGIGLILTPYLPHQNQFSGIWFISEKGRRLGLATATVAFLCTTAFILLHEFVQIDGWWPGQPSWVGNSILSIITIMVIPVGYYQFIKKIFAASQMEAVQTIFIFVLTAFIAITIIGHWFRGAGMSLVWPLS